jgi:phosphoadenosine phosphosulfate reductase
MQQYQEISQISDPVIQLKMLAEMHASRIAFSTSFGLEDQVISDMIFSNNIPVKVFTLDTGRLFPETYTVWNKTLEKYNKIINTYYPKTAEVEALVSEKGPHSFYASVENRKECCEIRKVAPLKRALENIDLWITGLRAEQSSARSNLDFFEKDASFGLVKFNPLKDWSFDELTAYVKKRKVPYNKLHDQGFVSIGCQPCTRAVKEGEDFRAGRWWWESSSKECGLHASRTNEPIINIKKL